MTTTLPERVPLGDDAELRPLRPEHTEEFLAHIDRGREFVGRFIRLPDVVTDAESARAYLDSHAANAAADTGRLDGIWSGGRLVGGVLLRAMDVAEGIAEVGCWLEPSAVGRGLVIRAARELVRWAIEERGIHRIEWRVAPQNGASIAVAQRLGMRRDGVLRERYRHRGTRYDAEVWSLLAWEWRAGATHDPSGDAATARLDRAFLDAADVAAGLVRHTSVRDRWSSGSSLSGMSVGALACHLTRQVRRVTELLGETSTMPVLPSVDEHYARAAWVTAESVDDPANDRSTDEAEAALGHARMLERLERDLAGAAAQLGSGTVQEAVDIPWQGWALRRGDFLHTRLLEIVVHTADLATSLQLPAPEFPEAAFAPVRDLLARLAVRRHGQAAVVDALARGERAGNVSAF